MTETDPLSPGDWIQVWMEDNNYTAAELAKEAGVSYGWLRRVLKGNVKLSEVIAYRIATVTSPILKADALLRHEVKYRVELQRLAIDKAKEEREDQMGTARTAYTLEGVTRKGLRCSDCGATWAQCSKKLWEQKNGPCCEMCEMEDTHDTISHFEAKQLKEAREAEHAEEPQRVIRVPVRPARLKSQIKPAALFPRRMSPIAKRLKRDFTVRPTKHYIQTYYKIGG